ncbi:hypothetical protein DPMN_106183 [Dreissena polymorpha]|uniref:Uncharacterized protein n=1 Tax=Dreissena polymorpha TaxID=45954 RepID=A0A9D4K4P7_DREPO|nr:hypothetical protein DPMN_106183 [Dreissena polymorpha]
MQILDLLKPSQGCRSGTSYSPRRDADPGPLEAFAGMQILDLLKPSKGCRFRTSFTPRRDADPGLLEAL